MRHFFVVTRKYFVGKYVIALMTSRRDHTSSTLLTRLAKPQRFRNIAVSIIIPLLSRRLVFTALHGMQSRYSDGNSVCPSVRPSNAWIVTKRKKAMFRFLYHAKEHSL